MERIGQHTEEVSARVRGNVLAALSDAGLTVESAAERCGCRLEALMGEVDLYWVELVAIAAVTGSEPARFFD